MGKSDSERGIYVKYDVTNLETGELVEDCFVLQPAKDPAALEAIRAYAQVTPNKRLAYDLFGWYAKISRRVIPFTPRSVAFCQYSLTAIHTGHDVVCNTCKLQVECKRYDKVFSTELKNLDDDGTILHMTNTRQALYVDYLVERLSKEAGHED